MERELDELRDRRDSENRRLDAERAQAEEIKKERIAERRLTARLAFQPQVRR